MTTALFPSGLYPFSLRPEEFGFTVGSCIIEIFDQSSALEKKKWLELSSISLEPRGAWSLSYRRMGKSLMFSLSAT